MSAPRPAESVRRRWIGLITAGALAVAGITGLVARGAAAEPVLPPLTASELLTRVATAQVDGLSATFEQRSDLGLPALPSGMGTDEDDLQTALGLLTGDHTIRVWRSAPDRAKVALVDSDTETSLIRNGDQLWTWSSERQQAGHATISSDDPRPAAGPVAPDEAVGKLLKALEPTTDLTTSGTGYVAGRAVYQLILTPKDAASLVGQVRVSIDATEFVPLGFRVVADSGEDAVSVAATSVDFSRPADAVFEFSPPPGVEVKELTKPQKSGQEHPAAPSDAVRVTGTGWTTIAVAKFDQTKARADQSARVLLESLPEVSGSWGKGRLLSTSLINAVITDDGRIAAGSVVPERLYTALAK